jgi:flagellar biosynthesis chaperone FliJ
LFCLTNLAQEEEEAVASSLKSMDVEEEAVLTNIQMLPSDYQAGTQPPMNLNYSDHIYINRDRIVNQLMPQPWALGKLP